MLHTLFGTFRWMPILGVLIGLVGTYFFWEVKQRIGLVDAEGVEAVATLIQIREQTGSQSQRTSYWADIKWRDASGMDRRQEKIPVSGAFARRVSKDRRLIQHRTRIKYLPHDGEMRPLLLEDGMHNSWQTPAMMWLSLAFAIFCLYGWVHMLRYERRAERKRLPA